MFQELTQQIDLEVDPLTIQQQQQEQSSNQQEDPPPSILLLEPPKLNAALRTP